MQKVGGGEICYLDLWIVKFFVLLWRKPTLRPNPKKKHSGDPMPELTVYLMSTPTHVPWALGNPMPESTLSSSLGLRIWPCFEQFVNYFYFQMAKWMETDPVGTVTWSLFGKWGRLPQSKEKKNVPQSSNQNSKDLFRKRDDFKWVLRVKCHPQWLRRQVRAQKRRRWTTAAVQFPGPSFRRRCPRLLLWTHLLASWEIRADTRSAEPEFWNF